MPVVGYARLVDDLGLAAFAPRRPALVKPVTRLAVHGDHLAVPAHVAPAGDDPLAHLIFALKHEGVNLQVLAQALPRIASDRLVAELAATPNGQFIRVACCLWEQFAGHELPVTPTIVAGYVDLFDPSRYYTGPSVRHPRWRVNFNGLGSLSYCVTVEKTEAIERAIAADTLGRTQELLNSLDKELTDRALSWAYLHETQDSYAIERETPSADKANAFIALLKQAHEPRALTEAYLVELQSSVVSNPMDKAVQFRVEQNWLHNGGRGAIGVTYVPPPPASVAALMDEWMTFANEAPRAIDPIMAASIASFGFVYIHPFTDGNGRLSRFLFHKALCTSGKLGKGTLLPVSVAMKRHEAQYLEVLQAFSRPARQFVHVTMAGEGDYAFEFKADETLFRYWDATRCVEFGFEMAAQALETELRQETEFLMHFDAVRSEIDARFDVRGSTLATLIAIALQGDGAISNNKRKRYADAAPSHVMDAIEHAAKKALRNTPHTP